MKLFDCGLVEYWKRIYYPKDTCLASSSRATNNQATLQDVQGVFVLLIIGVISSLFIFIMEHAVVHYLANKPYKLCNIGDFPHSSSSIAHRITPSIGLEDFFQKNVTAGRPKDSRSFNGIIDLT